MPISKSRKISIKQPNDTHQGTRKTITNQVQKLAEVIIKIRDFQFQNGGTEKNWLHSPLPTPMPTATHTQKTKNKCTATRLSSAISKTQNGEWGSYWGHREGKNLWANCKRMGLLYPWCPPPNLPGMKPMQNFPDLWFLYWKKLDKDQSGQPVSWKSWLSWQETCSCLNLWEASGMTERRNTPEDSQRQREEVGLSSASLETMLCNSAKGDTK